jgi:hypothetical protein
MVNQSVKWHFFVLCWTIICRFELLIAQKKLIFWKVKNVTPGGRGSVPLSSNDTLGRRGLNGPKTDILWMALYRIIPCKSSSLICPTFLVRRPVRKIIKTCCSDSGRLDQTFEDRRFRQTHQNRISGHGIVSGPSITPKLGRQIENYNNNINFNILILLTLQ